jgi:cytochrome c2
MNRLTAAASAFICVLGFATAASAYDGDWKRGRVYYRGVCTACHTTQKSEAIAPNSYTRPSGPHLRRTSTPRARTPFCTPAYPYRTSIRATNKVAEKFAEAPDKELFEDVKAFVVNGAKDGDAPASCN